MKCARDSTGRARADARDAEDARCVRASRPSRVDAIALPLARATLGPSSACALPIPRPSAAPSEGDRSARPQRADNRATATARVVSRRATRAGGTRRDVPRVRAGAWVRGTHLLWRSGLRGSVCRARGDLRRRGQTRGSRWSSSWISMHEFVWPPVSLRNLAHERRETNLRQLTRPARSGRSARAAAKK